MLRAQVGQDKGDCARAWGAEHPGASRRSWAFSESTRVWKGAQEPKLRAGAGTAAPRCEASPEAPWKSRPGAGSGALPAGQSRPTPCQEAGHLPCDVIELTEPQPSSQEPGHPRAGLPRGLQTHFSSSQETQVHVGVAQLLPVSWAGRLGCVYFPGNILAGGCGLQSWAGEGMGPI